MRQAHIIIGRVAQVVALLYVMIVTPFEVSFLGQPSLHEAIFWLNRLLDLIFVFDMFLQFFVIPTQLDVKLSVTPSNPDQSIRSKIAKHYLTGWFTVDLISILPFDLVAYLIEKHIESIWFSRRNKFIMRNNMCYALLEFALKNVDFA